MQTLFIYLQKRRRDYAALVAEARANVTELNTKTLAQLTFFALALLVIAFIGYQLQGYHFAFPEINSLASHIPEWVLHNMTVFGDGTLILSLVLALANRNVQLHWVVFWAAIIGAIVSNTLKGYFDAPRPPAVLIAGEFLQFGKMYKQYSFPSGHTLTAFLIAAVGYYFASRAWQKVGFIALGVMVGLSRIWLGVHWPIDTLVGGALGIFCGSAAVVIGSRWRSGINPVMHGFILFLLVVAALLCLLDKNDYQYALPMLYVVALLGLWRTIRNYLLPVIKDEHPPLTPTSARFPFSNTWAKPAPLFWGFLFVVTVYRLLVLLQPQFSLFYDEAYYYHWSLNPDLGYYSKPPMVAWFIMLATSLLGDTVFAIKMMACLAYSATAAVLFAGATRYSNTTNGLIAGVVFLCIPMIGFNSEFITTDAPLLLFWSLALYFTLRALETSNLSHWVLLGVFTGLGMLSKYTMGAFPLAVFLFLLVEKDHRAKLFTPGPWLAAIVAGAIFGLNIYWNFTHQWIAAQHTQEISHTSSPAINIGPFAEFVAVQFLIFGPVFSWLLIQVIRKTFGKTAATSQALQSQPFTGFYRLFLWVSGVILAAIGVQALASHAFPNWAGPWMVAASLLLALGWQNAYDPRTLYRRLGYGIAFNLVLLSMVYHWPQMLRWLDIEATAKNDPYHRLIGWPELGKEIRPLITAFPDAKLTSDSRDILAYIGYYARPGSFDFARWNPQADNIRDYYDLKVNLRDFAGNSQQTFVFVSKEPLEESLLSRFEASTPLGKVSTSPYEGDTMSLYLSLLRGFKGYE